MPEQQNSRPTTPPPSLCVDCREPTPAPGRILCPNCAARLHNPPPELKTRAHARRAALREAWGLKPLTSGKTRWPPPLPPETELPWPMSDHRYSFARPHDFIVYDPDEWMPLPLFPRG